MNAGDGLFGDPGFSGAGRRGHQTVAVLDGGKGIELERIRCESRVFRHPDFGKNFSESDIGARF